MKLVILGLMSICAFAYLDIPLRVAREENSTSFLMEMLVNGYFYNLSVSLDHYQGEFIQNVADASKTRIKVPQLEQKNPNYNFGRIKASSLEGYTFQGWKRYIMEVLLYIQQRYYHEITINLDNIPQHHINSTNGKGNGLLTLGPNQASNKIYNQIKKNSVYIREDMIAFYMKNDRAVRMQLGGFEEAYGRGEEFDEKDSLLFHRIELFGAKKWEMVVKGIAVNFYHLSQFNEAIISNKKSTFSLNLNSVQLVLPEQTQNSFYGNMGLNCSFSRVNLYLQCKNMTSIETSLSLISFKISEHQFLNISIHDLIKEISNNTTTFYIKKGGKDELQIGSSLLHSYYVAINMKQKYLQYSPLNNFYEQEFVTVVIARFFIYFAVFFGVAALCAAAYMFFGDPYRRNQIFFSNNSVQVVTYEKPSSFEFQ